MDTKTREALEASIKHWEENVAAETPEDASVWADHCSLCQTFEGCIGCPVAVRTDDDQCEGSPYYTAQSAYSAWKRGRGDRESWRAAAQAELDFLISLRPEVEGA